MLRFLLRWKVVSRSIEGWWWAEPKNGVYAKCPFAHPSHVVEYLGRYTHKVAISNSRLFNDFTC